MVPGGVAVEEAALEAGAGVGDDDFELIVTPEACRAEAKDLGKALAEAGDLWLL